VFFSTCLGCSGLLGLFVLGYPSPCYRLLPFSLNSPPKRTQSPMLSGLPNCYHFSTVKRSHSLPNATTQDIKRST
jgi:hypothetical protein